VFKEGFAAVYRAVDRIQQQLGHADDKMKQSLGDELIGLLVLGEEVIDDWLQLEQSIRELVDTHNLWVYASKPVAKIFTAKKHEAVDKPKMPLGDSIVTTAETSLPLTLIEPDFEWAVFGHDGQLDVHFRKGLAYYDLFMFNRAIDALEQTLKVEESAVARLYLAAAYVQEKHFQKAQVHLSVAKQFNHDPVFTCGVLEVETQLALRKGDVHHATRTLRQILEYLPELEDAWYNLAICLVITGQLQDAHHAAREVIRLNPTDPEGVCLYGQIQLRQGDVMGSLDTCAYGLNLHPRHRDLLLLSAVIAQTRGDFDACIGSCRSLLKEDPSYEPALTLLVHALLQNGRGQEAMTALKRDLSLHPGHSETLLQFGVITLLLGDVDRAERVLSHCLALHRDKSLIWLSLGKVSALRGDFKQANLRFLRAMKGSRTSIRRLALYLYGQLLDDNGRHVEANKYLRAASVLGSESIAILNALAANSETLGDVAAAEQLRHRVKELTQRVAPQ
jgi:tetratricopeptide (TPR) repeat protein